MRDAAGANSIGTGYLPPDRPPWPALISLGLQHVLAMIPATVLVAILTSFDVSVTLFASGLATTLAALGSRGRIPLWYGASFTYIAPVVAVVAANGGYPGGVRLAQGAILVTGFANIAVGLVISRLGKDAIRRILPPIVTGSIAIVIGVSLSSTALTMASGLCCLKDSRGIPAANDAWWLVALVSLTATIIYSVFLRGRGLLGLLPVLLGALTGYVVSIPFGLVDFSGLEAASWINPPRFTAPDFSWQTILAIAPVIIATIPENTAHLFQMSLYIDRLAEEKSRPPLRIKDLIGLNLVLDGIADCVNGMLGGCGGTSYSENMALMVLTRNYSVPVIIAAGIIAMLLGFFEKLAALVNTIPTAVSGGLAIYLFGVIALQGIALMISENVDLFDPRNLAIGAIILVVGIGGSTLPNSNIPVLGLQLPAIVTAAGLGILLNILLAPQRARNTDSQS